MSHAPTLPPATHKPVALVTQAAPVATAATDHSTQAVAEERRWLLMLVPPFAISAAFFAATIGTGLLWLLAPAAVLGPGLIILGFVYLGLTSDTNGSQ